MTSDFNLVFGHASKTIIDAQVSISKLSLSFIQSYTISMRSYLALRCIDRAAALSTRTTTTLLHLGTRSLKPFSIKPTGNITLRLQANKVKSHSPLGNFLPRIGLWRTRHIQLETFDLREVCNGPGQGTPPMTLPFPLLLTRFIFV